MSLNAHLVIIDPQKDFMDDPDSALPVTGANDDMRRLAGLIDRVGRRFADIHVTMDSHRTIDVGHPGMWQDQQGNHPAPYTMISVASIEDGTWRPRNPAFTDRLLAYARTLESSGKYQIMVWPEHCLIGQPGHNIQSDLGSALQQWERDEFANVNYVTKGTNAFTEHYGALLAEVPDPNDPSTMLNTAFLDMLADADIVAIAGEALSHCVKETVSQIAENIGEDHLSKFHILTDCTSPVPQPPGGPDFPAIAADWLKEMEAKGMKLTTSDQFLA